MPIDNLPPERATAEERKEQNPAPATEANPFFGKQSQELDDWLSFGADGTLTIYSGKVEVGTGTRTALAQIVAEELDVPFEAIRMVMGDTALTPDEGYTAGSLTIQLGGMNLRNAAAEARRALLEMAAEQLDAAAEELSVREGVVSVTHHPDRTISYTALIGGKKFNRTVTGDAPLKAVAEYHIVGTSVGRVDLAQKFTGQFSFITDLRVPNMLHGRMVRSASPSAQLVSIDETSIADIRGIVKIFRQGNFLGVITEREEQAVRAAKQLKVEWREPAALPRMEILPDVLRSQKTEDQELVNEGNLKSAFKHAKQQLHATYFQPYQAHASIGPSCAVADVSNGQATIWCSTGGPYPLRGALAQLLQIPPDQVHLIHVEGAGAYGQNGSDDVAADAAILSRAVGKPVRVQWSRQDEFVGEPKAAPMVIELHAGLDAKGSVIAWENDVYSPTHTTRPRFAPPAPGRPVHR